MPTDIEASIRDQRKALKSLGKELKRKLNDSSEIWPFYEHACETSEALSEQCKQLLKKHRRAHDALAVCSDAQMECAVAIEKAFE